MQWLTVAGNYCVKTLYSQDLNNFCFERSVLMSAWAIMITIEERQGKKAMLTLL